ncbi:MAG: TetR family transcriptional regulator [Bifidobacteriaceae bacterium]|nr:TetR family transcriptional regulator [Bifidobacteriaceae bacterium]
MPLTSSTAEAPRAPETRPAARPRRPRRPPKPGRRPGPDTTAQDILKAAREAFATRGYTQTSLRAVAEAAGVDVAMIGYFFGSKQGLFQAAIDVPISLDMPAMVELRQGRAEPAERIARFFFTLWESPELADALCAIVLEAGLNSTAARALRRFMFTHVGVPLLRELGGDQPEVRLRQIVGFMAAIALQRRFDRACLLAPLSVEELVALVAPTIRHLAAMPIPPQVAAAVAPSEEWLTAVADSRRREAAR